MGACIGPCNQRAVQLGVGQARRSRRTCSSGCMPPLASAGRCMAASSSRTRTSGSSLLSLGSSSCSASLLRKLRANSGAAQSSTSLCEAWCAASRFIVVPGVTASRASGHRLVGTQGGPCAQSSQPFKMMAASTLLCDQGCKHRQQLLQKGAAEASRVRLVAGHLSDSTLPCYRRDRHCVSICTGTRSLLHKRAPKQLKADK